MSAERAAALFRQSFGTEPGVVASAPGRVNLIGEHTDYNGGDVLPMALSLRTSVAASLAPDGQWHLVSEQDGARGSLAGGSLRRSGQWWDYAVGTAGVVDSLGVSSGPCRMAVASDVPVGAGLSSSAALEVAVAAAVVALHRESRQPRWLAGAAYRAEREFVGVPCGIMDQFASALGEAGKALLIACDTESVATVPFGSTVLVFDTSVPRALRGSAYGERRRECEGALAHIRTVAPDVASLARVSIDQLEMAKLPAVLHARARHVITETQRVRAFVQGLADRHMVRGDLLFASHESLRTDFACSCAELDWFVEQASQAAGVTGARLTGAGWGGCAIALGGDSELLAFATVVSAAYEATFKRTPRWWFSRASAGVRVDRLRE